MESLAVGIIGQNVQRHVEEAPKDDRANVTNLPRQEAEKIVKDQIMKYEIVRMISVKVDNLFSMFLLHVCFKSSDKIKYHVSSRYFVNTNTFFFK